MNPAPSHYLRLAAEAITYGAFVDNLLSALEADELFIISHDLTSLHPLRGEPAASLTDETLLDSLLGGTPALHGGVRFTPLMSRAFPLLVATGDTTFPPDAAALAGPIVDFHRDFFDSIETRRRPTAFAPAAQLQWSLLPVPTVRTSEWDVAGVLHPAASVAGDAYDLARTPAGLLTTLSMDAMGHGVGATLSTALALATMRTVRRAGGTLVEQVTAADDAMLTEYRGARFITMAALEFDDHGIRVVNAGHEPIRHLAADGAVTTLGLPADPPLGLDGHSTYRLHHLAPLLAGEGIVLLSDGAAGAQDPSGAALGDQAVNMAIQARRGVSSLQTADRIARSVMEYVVDELADDLSAVVVQRNLE